MNNEKNNIKGLTEKEIKSRLACDGYNELPSQKHRGFIALLVDVLKEPMLLLLFIACTIYFFLGEFTDALMLSAFVFFIIGITFYQNRKTERALEALRDLSSPRALVIRDGIQRRIAGRDVVAGDILVLQEGDRVAADAAVFEASNLMVDESLLTGESLAVAKSIWNGKDQISGQRPGGENLSFVYSGTLITRGHGFAKVMATGVRTEMGKIGKSLENVKEGEMLLRKETGRLAKLFGIIGGLLCLGAVLIYGLFRQGWLEGILYGITIGMSMLPEEFPVVMLIFLTLGAWRISKNKVLTRNTAAIEALGSVNVLCVDKTGTLTLNQMRLQTLAAGSSHLDLSDYDDSQKGLPEEYKKLLEYADLASQSDPFDPLEKEIKRAGEIYLFSNASLHASWELIKEYPFSGNLLALSHVWKMGDGDEYIVASKGAPESICDLCHLSDEEKKKILAMMRPMLDNGLRLLAVAAARIPKSKINAEHQHEFDFKFAGLLGFHDPIRPSARAAVKECYEAGIRVCMITGDYPGTAQHIAREIGLEHPENYITGSQMQKLGKEQLKEAVKKVNIFARVVPEQKMLIMDAFKDAGIVIAMTGDGVNDAPALKAAHVGIAMGERGTDVARETADIVLLNDDFSSIVKGIRMGRVVFDNIKKALGYIFSVHIPIAGMSFIPVAFNMPIVFMPAHIAFLELVIDPACTVVFEAEPDEADIMKRKPRKLTDRLFGKRAILLSFLQGMGALVSVYLVYWYEISQGRPEGEIRAIAFAAIVFANLALILSNLSDTGNPLKALFNGNKFLRWIFVATITMLGLILFVPALRNIFHFDPITVSDLSTAFIGGVVSVILLEFLNPLFKKKES